MAWPPPVQPINRTNADPQQDTHPADHNALSLAVNDLVEHFAEPVVPTRAGATCRSQVTIALPATAYTLTTWTAPLDDGGYFQGGGNPLRVPAGLAGMYMLTLHMVLSPTQPGNTASLAIRGLPVSAGANGIWATDVNLERGDIQGVAYLAVGAAPSVTLQAVGAAWSARDFDTYLSMYRISN